MTEGSLLNVLLTGSIARMEGKSTVPRSEHVGHMRNGDRPDSCRASVEKLVGICATVCGEPAGGSFFGGMEANSTVMNSSVKVVES